jgi:hypothetical protein
MMVALKNLIHLVIPQERILMDNLVAKILINTDQAAHKTRVLDSVQAKAQVRDLTMALALTMVPAKEQDKVQVMDLGKGLVLHLVKAPAKDMALALQILIRIMAMIKATKTNSIMRFTSECLSSCHQKNSIVELKWLCLFITSERTLTISLRKMIRLKRLMNHQQTKTNEYILSTKVNYE